MYDDRTPSWSFEREIQVRAKRYQDGSWRGSIETPTANGRAAICVEMRPAHVRNVVDSVRGATADAQRVVAAYRPALASIGETPRSALTKYAAMVSGGRGGDVVSGHEQWGNITAYPDIIGDFGSDVLGFLGRAATGALGSIPFVGPLLAGGLGATTGGGAAGPASPAGNILGQVAQGVGQLLSGGGQQAQQGGQQAPQGPFQGTTVSAVAQPVGARPAANVVNMADMPWTAPSASNYAANAAATQRAAAQEAAAGIVRQQIAPGVTVISPVTPGLAASAAANATNAASLGAAELSEQVRRIAIPTAADVAATALRAVDARAAAELGDPYARQVLQRAIASESQRVRSALQVARSLLDLR
jgi:hypothetical protein